VTIAVRYDLAALLNMNLSVPSQEAVFDKMLEHYACDDDWNEQVHLEATYKAVGLKRYRLEKQSLTRRLQEDGTVETLSSTSVRDHKGSCLSMLTGQEEPKVKIEAEQVLAMQQSMKVVRAGELKLLQSMQLLKKQKASCVALQTGAGWAVCVDLCFACCHHVLHVGAMQPCRRLEGT
jgi:hypothetical protein